MLAVSLTADPFNHSSTRRRPTPSQQMCKLMGVAKSGVVVAVLNLITLDLFLPGGQLPCSLIVHSSSRSLTLS
jgi:hypothetical protein